MFKKKKEKMKIFVVEDDPLLLRVLSEAVSQADFEIATAQNGLEVMSAVKAFSPKIILLDLILPGMDGFAVLKELKADKKTKDIPVAILSNLDSAGDVKSCKAMGADEYFIKANVEIATIIRYVKEKLND